MGAEPLTVARGMIPDGLVNALYLWAKGSGERTDVLTALRDELVTGQLTTKATTSVLSGTLNGKTVTLLMELSKSEKLIAVTNVLILLGAITTEPTSATANFWGLRR